MWNSYFLRLEIGAWSDSKTDWNITIRAFTTCRTRGTAAASWKNCKKENPGSEVDCFLLQLEMISLILAGGGEGWDPCDRLASHSPLSHGGNIGYDVCTLGMKSRRCVSNLRFAGIKDYFSMPWCALVLKSQIKRYIRNYLPSLFSRNICKGKLDCKNSWRCWQKLPG